MNVFTGSDILLVVAAVGASFATVVGAVMQYLSRRRHVDDDEPASDNDGSVYRLHHDDRDLIQRLTQSVVALTDEVIHLRRTWLDK